MLDSVPSHILVVEDDPDTCENLREILELDDYDVETADSIADSLRDRDWPALLAILLDRRLPDGTADDLLPELKKLAPEAAIIVITAYGDIESAISALRHGASDYLLKPIEPAVLRATLSRIADTRRAEGLFEMAIEAAPNSMLLVDREGPIVFANSPSYSMFGYEPGELEGSSIENLVPDSVRASHADYRARFLQKAFRRMWPNFFTLSGSIPVLMKACAIVSSWVICSSVPSRNR
jgi:PAS domain S-box-containing protein